MYVCIVAAVKWQQLPQSRLIECEEYHLFSCTHKLTFIHSIESQLKKKKKENQKNRAKH